MNIILDTKSGTYKKSIHKIEEKSNEKVFGFAVKLSTLEKYNVSISTVLKECRQRVIIDAEFDRLDTWLKTQLSSEIIKKEDLQRILITVQAKRNDAEEQLINLENLGVEVVLVAGHQVYLKKEEITRSALVLLAKYYQTYSNISYLGITSKMHDKLSRKLDSRINDNIILELYGTHKLMNSGLWVFSTGKDLSEEAKNYVKRRMNIRENLSFIKVRGLYFIRSKSELKLYNESRSIFVYLDIIDKESFIDKIKEMSE